MIRSVDTLDRVWISCVSRWYRSILGHKFLLDCKFPWFLVYESKLCYILLKYEPPYKWPSKFANFLLSTIATTRYKNAVSLALVPCPIPWTKTSSHPTHALTSFEHIFHPAHFVFQTVTGLLMDFSLTQRFGRHRKNNASLLLQWSTIIGISQTSRLTCHLALTSSASLFGIAFTFCAWLCRSSCQHVLNIKQGHYGWS